MLPTALIMIDLFETSWTTVHRTLRSDLCLLVYCCSGLAECLTSCHPECLVECSARLLSGNRSLIGYVAGRLARRL